MKDAICSSCPDTSRNDKDGLTGSSSSMPKPPGITRRPDPDLSASIAVTFFAPLTELVMVWAFARTRVKRYLHLYSTPLFDAVCNPICIRVIQNRLTEGIASLAALMIDSCIVLRSSIHSYRDGDAFARPTGRAAGAVSAYEAPHDVCVVALKEIRFVVVLVELKIEVLFDKQA